MNVLDSIDSSNLKNLFIPTVCIKELLTVNVSPLINKYLPKISCTLIRIFLHNRILIKRNFSLLVYVV